MNPQDDPRYHRLPVWVREGIDQLVRERDTAVEEYHAALLDTDPEGTNTHLMRGVHHNPVGLPNYAGVRFGLTNARGTDESYIDVKIAKYGQDKEQVVISGSGAVVVRHRSGNNFVVDLEDRA